MKFDDASWHYGGKFPKGLPKENGGTHIGLFVAWIIEHELISRAHLTESRKEVDRVRAREMTGRDFLFEVLDEKFCDEDLTPLGRRFTRAYFNDGKYIDHYLKTFGVKDDGSVYTVKDTWKNYERIKPAIERAFARWRKRQG
jgi:hypothetical protein